MQPIRYSIQGVGEVTWERLALRLDRKEAALRGTNAWVLLGELGLANVVKIIDFLTGLRPVASLPSSADRQEDQ